MTDILIRWRPTPTTPFHPMSHPLMQAGVAREMLRGIPDRAMEIITQGNFTGTDLVRLASDVHRPSFKDWGPIKHIHDTHDISPDPTKSPKRSGFP